MYATVEMRWFRREPLPAEVHAWFEARGSAVAVQPPRRDHYLGVTGETLSVKLREGRLEIKQRSQETELLALHPRVTGVLERWHKWSFALADPAGAAPEVMAGSFWLAVDKSRMVARYRVPGDRPPEAVAPDVYPAQGCNVELVGLSVRGERWWSLCFEAFGQGAALPEVLLATARHFLGGAEPPRLGAGDSYGYPHWLTGLAAQQ